MRASYAFVERNINLVRRYWGWEAVWMVYSVVNAMSITFIGAAMERGFRGRVFDDFVGTMGRYDRVHVHGAHQARDADDRDVSVLDRLWHDTYTDHTCGRGRVLPH
jgi:hypothetical protein